MNPSSYEELLSEFDLTGNLTGAGSSPSVLGRLGDYQLERKFAGGQSVVYQAFDPKMRRRVALKRLHAGAFATDEALRRLEREVDAARLLDHPNIVTVLAREQLDGAEVLILEWINGLPCDQYVQRCAPERPVDQVLQLFQQIGAAVRHAHQRGVVHRDLKPSNVLVDESGRCHLLDFGLAKPLLGSSELDGTINFVGTPAYAAPEQVDSSTPDTRSDVYSLGVILFEMLSGTLPYDLPASMSEWLRELPQSTAQPLTAVRADAPRDLAWILQKTLQREPEQRYQSVDALLQDLARFRRGEAVLAHPPSLRYRALKTLSKHWLPIAVTAVVLAATSATAFGFWRQSLDLEQQRQEEQAARKESDRSRAHAESMLDFFRDDVLRSAIHEIDVQRGNDSADNDDDDWGFETGSGVTIDIDDDDPGMVDYVAAARRKPPPPTHSHLYPHGVAPLSGAWDLHFVAFNEHHVVVELPLLVAVDRASFLCEHPHGILLVGKWSSGLHQMVVRQEIRPSDVLAAGPTIAFLKAALPNPKPVDEVRVVVQTAPLPDPAPPPEGAEPAEPVPPPPLKTRFARTTVYSRR